MAKEFKVFDKKFSKFQHILMCWETGYIWDTVEERAAHETRWDMSVESWTSNQIRYAVYETPDHEEWQKFRVSLKGWSTKAKLYRLKNYYKIHIFTVLKGIEDHMFERSESAVQEAVQKIWNIEKCRIDNYISALVRGGFLSADGEYRILK